MTRNEFIEKAILKHGNKYDYSLVEYIDGQTKVKIICPEHGEFFKTPKKHLENQGCRICSNKTRAEKLRYTTDIFIEKAKKIHGNTYDYSLVDYVSCDIKVTIMCKEHGEFTQTPSNHLNGQGCPRCSDNFKSNTADFIIKANKKHNFKYNYAKVEYVNNETKVCIICPEHGEFWQRAHSHICKGYGCPRCAGLKRTTEEFIINAMKVHGNKYNYSLVEYKNSSQKVSILCEKHGVFKQSPTHHVSLKQGCPECANEINKWDYRTDKITNEIFILRSKEKHNGKYDYSKSEYRGMFSEVTIICPEHGEFLQTAKNHIDGSGCGKCSGRYMDTEYFIEKSSIIHDLKYDYSKVNYIKGCDKVTIICPIHGEFEQIATNHLRNHGCWSCSESNGEKTIRGVLVDKNITYITNKKFHNCKDKRELPFDFYLPKYNMCIEYDGIQHFEVIEKFGGVDEFKEVQRRDKIKTDYCLNNNIRLIRIPYTEFENIKEILNKEIIYEIQSII